MIRRASAPMVLSSLLALAAWPDGPAAGQDETLRLDLGSGVTMELVLIKPGSFVMGADCGCAPAFWGNAAFDPWPQWLPSWQPAHRVTLTKPFYLGKCEVTREQWQAVMGSPPPDNWLVRQKVVQPRSPVTGVSWIEAQAFCGRLAKRCQRGFRLPTEAEWECACRAGTTTDYSFGDESKKAEFGWFIGFIYTGPMPVGLKKPNPWGLYDMHGNLSEWVNDWAGKDYYSKSPEVDPPGPAADAGDHCKIIRDPCMIRPNTAWTRRGCTTAYLHPDIGFRVVCVP